MYKPAPDLADDVRRELERVSDALANSTPQQVTLAQLNAQPAKYTDGMVVYADGTNWNPGSGEGVYCYYNATWNYLG